MSKGNNFNTDEGLRDKTAHQSETGKEASIKQRSISDEYDEMMKKMRYARPSRKFTRDEANERR